MTNDNLASSTLARLVDAWIGQGLPLFDLVSAMFVHGAAGMIAETGEAECRAAFAELMADLNSQPARRTRTHATH